MLLGLYQILRVPYAHHPLWLCSILSRVNLSIISISDLGPSINYVSTFEGGWGTKMLMVADVRGRGVSAMLTSAKVS